MSDRPLDALVERLCRTAAMAGTRALLVIEPEDSTKDSARHAANPDRQERASLPGPPELPELPELPDLPSQPGQVDRIDRTDRIAAPLGSEQGRVVHDARGGLDPALLAAEAGTIPLGGVLILLRPPTRPSDRDERSRFDRRVDRLLDAYLDTETDSSARLSLPARTLYTHLESLRFTPPPVAIPAQALAEQDDLLRRALTVLEEAGRPLLVIEAPRGHGKSTLLARIAAALVETGARPVVCATHRRAVATLEGHYLGCSPAHTATPSFLAPDAACAGAGDVLLVDEAASLPLPVLERLFRRWRRVVLATTSSGYEAAGRAFAVRLPGVLDRERPGWTRLTPATPLRFGSDDALDALVARIGLIDRPLDPVSPPVFEVLHELPVTRVDRDALVEDEDRLASLHGLLAATHYQSGPNDLARLLDGPSMAVRAIEWQGRALGAAIVAFEPATDPALHEDVLARRRRLPHRLLPQLLAQSADDDRALSADFARIVRIAVHPDCRRRGVARRLVAAIMRDSSDVEAVGASFGETSDTVAFWNALGFRPFHRGFRRNPRSGTRSLAVLCPLSGRVREVLDLAAAIHDDNERAEVVCLTGRGDPQAPPVPHSPARDRRLLARFVAGERSFNDTVAALHRLAERDDRIPGDCPTRTNASVSPGRYAVSSSVRAEPGELLAAMLRRYGMTVPATRRERDQRLRRHVAGLLALP